MKTLVRLALVVAAGLLTVVPLAAQDEGVRVKFADLPSAVKKTLERESIGGTISDVFKYSEDLENLYLADVTLGEEPYEILITSDGTLVTKVLDDGKDTIEEDMEVEFEDCPTAVQKTFRREANGFKIEVAIKRTTNDEIEYEADATIDGREYTIVVSDEGKLISKTLVEDDENEGEEIGVIVI